MRQLVLDNMKLKSQRQFGINKLLTNKTKSKKKNISILCPLSTIFEALLLFGNYEDCDLRLG